MVGDKIRPFAENIAESTAACLITMVQGNILALGLGHWIVASQTGVVAGGVTAATVLLVKARRRWIVAATLGVVTAVVDFMVHPGAFGPEGAEAIVTGVAAAGLSLAVGFLWDRRATSRQAHEPQHLGAD